MSLSPVVFSSRYDDWETPDYVFDYLNKFFGPFTLDPAAMQVNARAGKFFTSKENGLRQPWTGESVFCNPPYGRNETRRWVAKAIAESSRTKKIIMLLPSRTDQRWFQDCVDTAVGIYFIQGRIKFKDAISGAPFPSLIVGWNPEPRKQRAFIECITIGRQDAI